MTEKRLIAASAGRLSQVIGDLRRPFATLLWVESLPKERPEAVIDQMIAAGCTYFVCVGSNSELTHDLIDDRVVALGASGVTTTFHEDEPEEEVFDFFLSCAAEGMSSLLAMVEPGSRRERAIRDALAASTG